MGRWPVVELGFRQPDQGTVVEHPDKSWRDDEGTWKRQTLPPTAKLSANLLPLKGSPYRGRGRVRRHFTSWLVSGRKLRVAGQLVSEVHPRQALGLPVVKRGGVPGLVVQASDRDVDQPRNVLRSEADLSAAARAEATSRAWRRLIDGWRALEEGNLRFLVHRPRNGRCSIGVAAH